MLIRIMIGLNLQTKDNKASPVPTLNGLLSEVHSILRKTHLLIVNCNSEHQPLTSSLLAPSTLTLASSISYAETQYV